MVTKFLDSYKRLAINWQEQRKQIEVIFQKLDVSDVYNDLNSEITTSLIDLNNIAKQIDILINSLGISKNKLIDFCLMIFSSIYRQKMKIRTALTKLKLEITAYIYLLTMQGVYSNIVLKWDEFKTANEYLTIEVRDNFQALSDKVMDIDAKLAHLFSKLKIANFKIQVGLQNKLKTNCVTIQSEIDAYDEEFIASEIATNEDIFYLKGIPLDEEQCRACVIDEKHNLAIAGAGSGKTSVLMTRISYLVNRKSNPIPSKRILVLAYQSNAITEIKQRLRDIEIRDVVVKTFHSLGLEILRSYENRQNRQCSEIKVMVEKDFIEIIKQNLNYAKSNDEDFKNLLSEYLLYCLDESEKSLEDFDNDRQKYYDYLRHQRYIALDGTKLKSYAEREIYNIFLMHTLNEQPILIEYEKEAKFMQYVDKQGNARSVHPDFYFPQFDIYWEHWAVDENGIPPAHFEGDYVATMMLKLEKFKENNKILIETRHSDYESSDFIKIIKTKFKYALNDYNIRNNKQIEFNLERLSDDELIVKYFSMAYNVEANLLNFINIAKSSDQSRTEIEHKLSSNKYSSKQLAFTRVALHIFDLYNSELSKLDSIDYADMINLSIKALQNSNFLEYLDKYDHILVDEFQDISYPRYRLLIELIKRNPNCKLFCVGDDWQSIMAFAGAELDIFVDFSRYFKNVSYSKLINNYRSIQLIVDVGKNVIKQNRNVQVSKAIQSKVNSTNRKITIVSIDSESDNVYLDNMAKNCIQRICNELKQSDIKPSDIMLLTRIRNPRLSNNLSRYADKGRLKLSRDLQTSGAVSLLTVHKSKGLEAKSVYILNLVDGLYGFPCKIADIDILLPARRQELPLKEQEERRLFYVAVSRAKSNLVIYTRKGLESQFISELGEDLCELKLIELAY